MSSWVRSGMRAQLAAGNVLSGRKLIRLVDSAAPAGEVDGVDFNAIPYPEQPTIPATNLGAVSSNVQQIVANFAVLPVDELVRSMISLVDGAGGLLNSPAMAKMPDELQAALISISGAAGNIDAASRYLPVLINHMISAVSVGEQTLAGLAPESEVYTELSGALTELRAATFAVAELLETLEEKPNALLLGK